MQESIQQSIQQDLTSVFTRGALYLVWLTDDGEKEIRAFFPTGEAPFTWDDTTALFQVGLKIWPGFLESLQCLLLTKTSPGGLRSYLETCRGFWHPKGEYRLAERGSREWQYLDLVVRNWLAIEQGFSEDGFSSGR